MKTEAKILIVDDNRETLAFLSDLLSKEGYNTLPADSGELALAALDNQKPDLILLDIRMPGISGFEVCKKIKARQDLCCVPIIFLTVATEINDKLEGFKLGGVDYLTKPFHKEELMARVKTHLDLYRYNTMFKEKSAQQLIESESKLSAIFNHSLDALGFLKKGEFISVNPAFVKLFGYETEEKLTGSTIFDLIVPEEQPKVKEYVEKLPEYYETWGLKKDGSRFFMEVSSASYSVDCELYSVVTIRDLTKQKETEKVMTQALENKEMLLREVHHRVKNNMQLISSFIGIQKIYEKDKRVLDKLEQIINRIKTIGLVHAKLYKANNLEALAMKEYLMEIIEKLKNLYARPNITIENHIDNPVLRITLAIPTALMLHELMTNAFKYAFPEEEKGVIKISFKKTGSRFILSVSDNGVGLPADFDISTASSLGLQIIKAFANQLKGSVDINRKEGTGITVTFPGLQPDA